MKKELLNKLNKGLEKIFNEVNKNYIDCIGEKINLKLYDCIYIDNFNSELFEMFCEDSYYDYCKFKKDLYVEEKYIGYTSSFYIVPKGNRVDYYYMDEYNNADYKEKIVMLFDDFLINEIDSNYCLDDLLKVEKNKVADLGEYFFDFLYNFNYSIDELVDGFIKFINEYIEDVKKVYDYIDNFKKNQVEYFEDYINFNKEV